jgi:hypothetical protein
MRGYAALERVRRVDVRLAWIDPGPPERWDPSVAPEPSPAQLDLGEAQDRGSVRATLGYRLADCRAIWVQTTFFLMDRDNSWL